MSNHMKAQPHGPCDFILVKAVRICKLKKDTHFHCFKYPLKIHGSGRTVGSRSAEKLPYV